jgi:hypothetical protein
LPFTIIYVFGENLMQVIFDKVKSTHALFDRWT